MASRFLQTFFSILLIAMMLVPGSALAYEWSQDDATVEEMPVTDMNIIQLYGQYLLAVWYTGAGINHDQIFYAKAGLVSGPIGHNITWGSKLMIAKGIWYGASNNFELMAVSQLGSGGEGLIALSNIKDGMSWGQVVIISVDLDETDLSLDKEMNTTIESPTSGTASFKQFSIDLCKFGDDALLAIYNRVTYYNILRTIYDDHVIASDVQVFSAEGDPYDMDVCPLTDAGTTVLFSSGRYYRAVTTASNDSGVNLHAMYEVPDIYGDWKHRRVSVVDRIPSHSFLVVGYVNLIQPYPYLHWVGMYGEISGSYAITFRTAKQLAEATVANGGCQSILLSFDTDSESDLDEHIFIYQNVASVPYFITIDIVPSNATYGFMNDTSVLLSSVFNAPDADHLGYHSSHDGDLRIFTSYSFIYCPYLAWPNNDHYVKFLTTGTFGDYYAVDFVGIPTSGQRPLTVNFTYIGIALPNRVYHWSFGDGSTATVVGIDHIEHEYAKGGYYTVTLIVGTDVGEFSESKVDYIGVWNPEPEPLLLSGLEWGTFWLLGIALAFMIIVIMFKRGR